MTCIRILESTVISAFNSKPERIEGSRIFKVYLGKLEFSPSAVQCGIIHKAFCLSTFHISSTNHKRSQDKKMRIFSDDALVFTYEIPSGKGYLFQNKRFYEALKKEDQSEFLNIFIS